MKNLLRTFAVLGTALACMSSAYADAEFTLEIVDAEVPADLRDVTKAELVPKAYRLSDGDGLFYEFWFVKGLVASEQKEKVKDTLNKVEPISLLGAVMVHREERYDFREDPVDPGLYVLRLALQPQDGNHMGTAPFDTFAIMMPHDKDHELDGDWDHELMVDLASEDTPAEHPPILALFPLEKAEGDFPRLDVNEEHEWHMLSMKWPTQAGGEAIELPLQLVFEGIGDL